MIIGHTPAPRHAHKFGLPVNGHHLSGHRGDAGVQRQLGQVSTAVSMAEQSEERLSLKKKKTCSQDSSPLALFWFVENFDFLHIVSDDTLLTGSRRPPMCVRWRNHVLR